MDDKLEAPTAQHSLLLLNDYCLLDIFEFLKLSDLINLAGSCSHLRRVIDRIFKRSSEYELDSLMVSKGEEHINHILSYIGQYVFSLKIICSDKCLNLTKIIGKICNDSQNLSCLRIYNWRTQESQDIPSEYSFDSVELLVLNDCILTYMQSFLKKFHKLKSFNLYSLHYWNSIDPDEFKIVLKNNPNMVNFVYWNIKFAYGHNFHCKLIKLIPNVERLILYASQATHILKLKNLLQLDKLTKLRIHCGNLNINNFLRRLAKKGIIEELQLSRIYVDDDFLDILKSFDKLVLLILVSSHRKQLNSSIVWPKKLKQLRLAWFNFTHNDFITIIRDLKYLESIDLYDCGIKKIDQTSFEDVTNLYQQILLVIDRDHQNRRKRLDVVLPDCVKPSRQDPSTKYLIDSQWFRIHWPHKTNQLEISIHFPGCIFN